MSVYDQIAEAQASAIGEIENTGDLDSLKAIEPVLFGKKSALSGLKRLMGDVDVEERADVGQALNEAQQTVREAHAAAKEKFELSSRKAQLESERLDLTESLQTNSRGHLHLVTQTMERLEDVFVGMGFTVSEGPQAETDWYNFEALNLPAAHPARSMFDTLYLDLGERTEIGDGEGGEATNILLRT
ncbi:MAG: hypothetical protein VX760_05485, partial [Actinomycetota bacterium]|nr:hypothetical protein [Actinomycetota bacterium]